MQQKIVSLSLLVVLGVCLPACSAVEPWQKGNLAKRHMQFDPDPVEAHFSKKVYQSKEASSGGYGVGGGGCGCN